MFNMEERTYLINLYDIYGNLLTDKQKNYFEDYYFNNLTLSEISDNDDITRNAVHKHIKDAKELIKYYESILKINERNNKIEEFSKKLSNELEKELKELI